MATNRSSLYFDEEELVELYDYASDLRDRYTALEVLFCGERLYPSVWRWPSVRYSSILPSTTKRRSRLLRPSPTIRSSSASRL